MPFYDYRCASCGEFRAMRPLAESALPQPCPSCRDLCGRVLVAPYLADAAARVPGPRPQGGDSYVRWRASCGFGCARACCR